MNLWWYIILTFSCVRNPLYPHSVVWVYKVSNSWSLYLILISPPEKKTCVLIDLAHLWPLHLFDWDHWIVVKCERKTWWKSCFWFGHCSFIVIETINWMITAMNNKGNAPLPFAIAEFHFTLWRGTYILTEFQWLFVGKQTVDYGNHFYLILSFSCKQKCPSLGRRQGWFCSSVILLDLNSPYNVWLKKKKVS